MTKAQIEAKRAYHVAYSAAWREGHPEQERAYHAAYYAAHKEERRAYSAAYNEAHRDASREKDAKEFAGFTEWLQILRTVNGCEDCGAHEGRLDHHHVDPETKMHNISGMYARSLDALEDELERCVVLCRSCHMKRHYR